MNTTSYSADSFPSSNADAQTVRLTRPTTASRPALDATRLWTGGLATAAVSAMIGFVGVLVLRAVAVQLRFPVAGALNTDRGSVLLCTGAAIAALAATAIAHLLLVSTPRPLAYLGWIIGLATAAATVLPLTFGLPFATASAHGVLNLVIGLTIGSLAMGAAYSASRGTAAR